MNFYNAYIRRCREAGVAPSAAAESVGLSKSTVSRWKAGAEPTDRTIATIAARFGMSVQQFLSDETGGGIEIIRPARTAKAELINAAADMDEATAARALTILRAAGLIT